MMNLNSDERYFAESVDCIVAVEILRPLSTKTESCMSYIGC